MSSGLAESLLCRLPGDVQAGPDGFPGLAGLPGPDGGGGEFGFGVALPGSRLGDPVQQVDGLGCGQRAAAWPLPWVDRRASQLAHSATGPRHKTAVTWQPGRASGSVA
jgi:hypothetical protein